MAFADRGVAIEERQLAADLFQAAHQRPLAAEEGTQGWQDWFVVACPTSMLKCRSLRVSRQEVEDLARSGGVVVVLQEDEWGVLSGTGALTLRRGGASGPTRSDVSFAKWVKTDVVDVVVLESGFPANTESHHHASPWKRLIWLVQPELPDILTILIHSLVIALLTLATPLAVESLVNTVAFGRLVQPIVVLSIILLGFLSFSAALKALQGFVAEIIQRRIFARVASDLSWRLPRVAEQAVEGRNMTELVNRFFDVVTVQKVVSQFLLDGVGIVLTTLIGMTVMAFYHPMLLAFDLVLLAAIFVILTVLGIGAVGTSIKESKFKYSTAETLEEIVRCPLLFKGDGGAEYALQKMDTEVAGYLDARKKHYRVLLRQIIAALMLQAIASTALLALGGWLVINGQLSLGQLVAAELIVSMIVSSVAKFGKHLESFYDLLASIDKLGYLFDLPVESYQGAVTIPEDRPFELALNNLGQCNLGQNNLTENVVGRCPADDTTTTIRMGECVALLGRHGDCQSLLDQLYGLRRGESGEVHLSGVDIRDIRADLLRRDVALIRRFEVLDGTIADNVVVGRPSVTHDQVSAAISVVGLESLVNNLPLGIRTPLAINGSPLTRNEVILLMLARAIANHPRLLLIDGTLDALSDEEIESLIATGILQDKTRVTLLVTGRKKLQQYCTRQFTLKTS